MKIYCKYYNFQPSSLYVIARPHSTYLHQWHDIKKKLEAVPCGLGWPQNNIKRLLQPISFTNYRYVGGTHFPYAQSEHK